MTRACLLVVTVAALGASTACGARDDGECEPCPPPITIEVVDSSTGEPVPGATIRDLRSDVQGDCAESDEATLCTLDVEPGTYDLMLEADGYAPQRIFVRVDPSSGDRRCDCGYVPIRGEIPIAPFPVP